MRGINIVLWLEKVVHLWASTRSSLNVNGQKINLLNKGTKFRPRKAQTVSDVLTKSLICVTIWKMIFCLLQKFDLYEKTSLHCFIRSDIWPQFPNRSDTFLNVLHRELNYPKSYERLSFFLGEDILIFDLFMIDLHLQENSKGAWREHSHKYHFKSFSNVIYTLLKCRQCIPNIWVQRYFPFKPKKNWCLILGALNKNINYNTHEYKYWNVTVLRAIIVDKSPHWNLNYFMVGIRWKKRLYSRAI